MSNSVLEKIYAGFLGMNAGIRLGAPVEFGVWSYERIKEAYGEIGGGYLRPYKTFAADDDANGPVFFVRALDDCGAPVTPEKVAHAWLNYTREGKGMFWWGGEGTSAEHTAYMNLKRGVPAPCSGSAAQNGSAVSEQIGGQIFIDTWGLIHPGDPVAAARDAMAAASVSHDGEAVYGAGFIAACIAAAFTHDDIFQVIAHGLAVIPRTCTYFKMVRDVMSYSSLHRDNWHETIAYIMEKWNNFPGQCHIIPNAAICIMALSYGGGNLARTIEIATMAGLDTDCNAGTVGTIIGVFKGLDSIPSYYRNPINDTVILSSAAGSLNMLDIPTFAKELYMTACKLSGETPDPDIKLPKAGEKYFDFMLPGSTHGFRRSNQQYDFALINNPAKSKDGKGALSLTFEHRDTAPTRLYFKPFYRRNDFEDERYEPVFAPTLTSGQTVRFDVSGEMTGGYALSVTPYIHLTFSDDIQRFDSITISEQEGLDNPVWRNIEFTVPDTAGDIIDEVGLLLETPEGWVNGRLYIDSFSITGGGKMKIDFSKTVSEFNEVIPFASTCCKTALENGSMTVEAEKGCRILTGNYYTDGLCFKAKLIPESGHTRLAVAASGVLDLITLGFEADGSLSIVREGTHPETLAKCEFNAEFGKPYELKAEIEDGTVSLSVNGEKKLTSDCGPLTHGMWGFASDGGKFTVIEAKARYTL